MSAAADTGRVDRMEPPRDPALVVAVGASAGGVTALREFFRAAPANDDIAWVVILHLSPDYESQLSQVLQHATPMPVTPITEATPIEAGRVYVATPSLTVSFARGTLHVEEATRTLLRRSPLDACFRSLADAYGSRSVCVILSGTGQNGSAGLKRVKEYGGIAIAQQPEEAEYDDMPRNAIATGLVDVVLPVREIPPKISEYLARLRQQPERPSEPPAPEDGEALREVITLLRVRTGHDFSNYKTATLRRRVDRRMNLRGAADLVAYARLIRQEPDEAVALMKELLISVTNFFRDPEAWQVVERTAVPRMFAGKTTLDHVRAWVPGCATGEEAYSLAMLLAEHASRLSDMPAVQVFATDLDESAIAVAREGFYTDAEVVDVSEARLARFFIRESGGYRVRRDLREILLFAHHNVIKDPPFSHLDLISCRNLLIYLNRTAQERVIETFHFALRPGGVLFLGSSESPDGTNDLFLRLDPSVHLYESRSVASRLAVPIAETGLTLPRPARPPEPRPDRIAPADLHQRLLEQYAPPSLVATEEHNVVHMTESVGRYLEMSGGEPTRDLLRLVRPELRPDLRTALHEAAKDRTNVDVRGVLVGIDHEDRRVDVSVRPVLRDGDPARGYFLVLFTESESGTAAEPASVRQSAPAGPMAGQLEEELTRVKAQLRTTIEQYETQAEESKASNEELQAMNEELRSAAEELETSKEELQSVNEELTTVNQELKIKIEELRLTNNDFQNFINSSEIGTIFLDRSFRVKLFTPRAHDVFNLLDTDVGRPLSDITSAITGPGIHDDVRRVLDSLQTMERTVQTVAGRWYLMRILPYRTSDNRIDGVVVTFQDVTERRRAERRVQESEERLRLVVESAVDYAILTMDAEGVIQTWSAGAERVFGYRDDEIIGRKFALLFTQEDQERGAPARELEQARVSGRTADEREHVRKDGSRIFISGVTMAVAGGALSFAKIARDLTTVHAHARSLQEAKDSLETRVHDRTRDLEREKSIVVELLNRLVASQENERSRIARDLHDDVGQQVTALTVSLERHQAACTGDAGGVTGALDLARAIGRTIDFLAWELRPAVLDDFGLDAALPRFVDAWSRHVGVPARYSASGATGRRLSPSAEVTLYRVAQEALHNVAKHADAKAVDVSLTRENDQVTIRIADDGVGFDPASVRDPRRGFGLSSMRERALAIGGTLTIQSTPGAGATVVLRAPAMAPGPMKVIRVFLAEDHTTVREALRLLLESQPDIAVVGEAADGAEIVRRTSDAQADVVVLDVTMPGIGGFEAARDLRDHAPGRAVVVLSRHDDQTYVREMLAAGVAGYVLKQSPSARLLDAIRSVWAGDRYVDPQVRAGTLARPGDRRSPLGRLTDREAEVLRRAALGESNKQIAEALDISIKTVEVHKANAMRKVGLRDRADLLRFAVLRGWLRDP